MTPTPCSAIRFAAPLTAGEYLVKNVVENAAGETTGPVGKKPWKAPQAQAEAVREVTRGIQGGAGDGFNTCHS